MRKISMLMIAMVFFILNSIQSQTILNPGDLVIVSANSDGSDNFDFIPLVDLEAGTVIYFTDNAWTNGDVLTTTEGTLTWTASTPVSKGTVVSFTGVTAGNWVEGPNFDLINAGDNLLAYQGSSSSPSFLYGIGWGKTDNWTYTGASDSKIPATLSVANKTILQLGAIDNYMYNGLSSGTASQLLAMVAYAPYWKNDNISAFLAYPTAFTITTTTSCSAPYALSASNITTSEASLSWSTFGSENSWNIQYGDSGFVYGTGTTVSGVTNPYTLNGLSANKLYQYYVQADCGGGTTSTVAGPFTFRTLCGATTTFPFNEPLNTYPPNYCWYEGVGGNYSTGPTTISSNASIAWIQDGFLNSGNMGAARIKLNMTGKNDWMISPEFTIPATPFLQLKYSVGATQQNLSSAPQTLWEDDDYVEVLITTSYPTNWTVLKTYNNLNTPSYLGQINILDLSAYTGQNVRIAYRGVEGATDGLSNIDFFIDNVIIETAPNCEAPTSLTSSSLTHNSATLGWTASGSETTWNIKYGVSGFDPATGGTIVVAGSKPYTLNGLSPNTTYDFYVQADCGARGTSAFSISSSFTTKCAPASTFPWVEGFETGFSNGVDIAGCWSQTSLIGSEKWFANNLTDRNRSPKTGSMNAVLKYGNADWMFYPFSLTAGTNYAFEMHARQDGFIPTDANITVAYGTNADVASMTNPIIAQTGLTNGDYQKLTGTFTPVASGIYYIGIKGYTSSSIWYLSIDDLKLDIILPCLNPDALTATSITKNSAVLRWNALNGETAWSVEYGISGFTLGTGIQSTATADTLLISNLTSNTAYQFYVQANCGGANGSSSWAGPFSFTTPLSCLPPANLSASAITSNSATLGWDARNGETAWNIEYGASGFTLGQGTSTTATSNSASLSFLSANTAYQFYVQANCGGADGSSSWAGPFSFATPCNVVDIFPYTESFESSFPICWNASEGAPNAITHWKTAITDNTHGVIGAKSGTHFMSLDVFDAAIPYNPYYLTTPAFALDGTAKQVKYYYYLGQNGYTSNPVPLTLQISTNNGSTWTDLYAHTNLNSTFSNSSDLSGWTENTISLSAYTNQEVKFRFVSNSNYNYGFCNQELDEFVIENAPVCIPPTALHLNTISTTAAKVGWTAENGESSWNVEYGASGFTLGQGTQVTTTSNPFTITGLTANTDYQFYVQATCTGANGSSTWAGPFSFTTLCPGVTIPYTQDFEGAIPPALPGCMYKSNDNADPITWGTIGNSIFAHSGTNFASIGYNSSSNMNDWMYTHALILEAGKTYRVSFYYRTPNTFFPGKLEVKYGTSANAAAMTSEQIFNNESFATESYTFGTGIFTPPSNGKYYIGFHGYSNASLNEIYIDDINVNETVVISCATPTELGATNIAETSADLGWTSTATNFNVRYRAVGAADWISSTASANTLSLNSLTANTQYEFQVQAVCSATAGDTSNWAATVNFTTLTHPVCETPTALAVTNIAQTTADLGWTSTATNFNVRYRAVGAADWISSTASANTLSLNSLTANTQYEFQVQAVCSATAGDTSNWAATTSFTTLAVVPTCDVPTALVVNDINATGASLSWSNGGTETAWNIRYKKVADATYSNINNTTTKPHVLTGLEANTAYVWNVQAICSQTLNSVWSGDNTFLTTVGIDHNALGNLSVFSNNSQVNILNNGNILVKAIVLYDLLGQEVGKYNINSKDNILINSNLTVGNYVVKVITETKVGNYKLFIK